MNAKPIPSLDGVRAIAVALVFLAHSGLERVIPGGLGVTIFFVLSGYLISTLLRIEYAESGQVSYRNFYLRRFLRLMPPLFICVFLTLALSAVEIVDPFEPNGLFSVLFYYGNYYVIAHNFQGVPDGMSVVWSLAVEEHYYFLYPPLAALLLRIGRVGVSATALSALWALVLGWRCWLAAHGASPDYIGMATDTRIDAILIGCLLALVANPWLDPPSKGNRLLDVALIAASLGVLLFSVAYRDEFFRQTVRYTLQSAAIAVLLYFAVARASSPVFKWLNHPVLVYVGTISYTVYLAHHVILRALAHHAPSLAWPAATLSALGLTWMIAELMRRWVEQPCATLRKRLHRQPSKKKHAMQTLSQATTGNAS